MATEPTMALTVCFSAAQRSCVERVVQVPLVSTIADAVRASGLLADLSDAAVDALEPGIWGRKLPADHLLRAGDRVELYRALKVDPKVARRERFIRQGAGTTGLFSKRRAGAKSGY